TNHVVILQPKDTVDLSNSAQTFQVFKLTVDHKVLQQEKITIKGKKLTSKNRVVLSCGSERECEALCAAMATNNVIQAKVPKKKHPQIQILGIDESIPKEEVFSLIVS